MLAESIRYCIERGYYGRIGLHSLPQSVEYYSNKVYGLSFITDYDSNYYGLAYFESI